MTRLSRSVFLVVIAFISGCSLLDADPDASERLDDARARWSAQSIDGYAYTFRRTACECLPEWTRAVSIQVERNAVTRVTDAETGELVTFPFASSTISDLFDLVADAIDRRAYRLTVEYHPRLGYPTYISVDYDRQVGDDEFTIHALDLQPIR